MESYFNMKKVNSTNVALGNLLLRAISKKVNKQKVLFNYFDKF